MSTTAYGRWEVFVGVVGVLTAIPLLFTLVYMHLPSRKVRSLFETLESANTILDSSIEDGLLRESHIRVFRAHLEILQNRAREVRNQAHSARGCTEDFANMLKGLTSKISRIEEDVLDVGAIISTTSSREREERARAEAARRMVAESGTTAHDPSTCTIALRKEVWRFIKSTPHRLFSLLSSWASPPKEPRLPCYELRSLSPVPPDRRDLPSIPSLISATPPPSVPPPHAEIHALDDAHPPAAATSQGSHPSSVPESLPYSPPVKRKSTVNSGSHTRPLTFSRRMRRYRLGRTKSSLDDRAFLIPKARPSSVPSLHAQDDEGGDIGKLRNVPMVR